jgi:hypothetical protein
MTSVMRIARAGAVLLAGAGAIAVTPAGVAFAEAPNLTIDHPMPGSWTNNQKPQFSGRTNDSVDVVVLKVFNAGGALVQTLATTPALGLGTWAASPESALPPGPYTAIAEQQNVVFETGKSSAVKFTVDIEPPVVSIQPPRTPTNDATPTLKGGAGLEVDDRPFVGVVIYLGAPAYGDVAVPLHEVAVSAGEWSYRAPHLPDGTYTAQAVQMDIAGNIGKSAVVEFTIDTGPPDVAISTPEPNAILTLASPTVSGTSGQAPGDHESVTLTIFSGSSPSGIPSQVVELAPSSGTWSTALAPLANGIYTAVAEQSDDAGNTGRAVATFAIDATLSPGPGTGSPAPPHAPPVASFRWFPAAPHVGESVSLVSSSSDPGSPITALAWDLTGGGSFAGGGAVVTTSFSTVGAHVVRLRVIDGNGLSGVATQTITVTRAPGGMMQPFPVVRIAGWESYAGVRISLLTVQAPVGARVRVVCRGRGCPGRPQSLVAASRTSGAPAGTVVIELRRFERALRAGAVLEIRISKAGEIGKYTRFAIRRGKLPARFDSCLAPAGIAPIVCPSS